MGMGQNKTTRGPQLLVFGSICHHQMSMCRGVLVLCCWVENQGLPEVAQSAAMATCRPEQTQLRHIRPREQHARSGTLGPPRSFGKWPTAAGLMGILAMLSHLLCSFLGPSIVSTCPAWHNCSTCWTSMISAAVHFLLGRLNNIWEGLWLLLVRQPCFIVLLVLCQLFVTKLGGTLA